MKIGVFQVNHLGDFIATLPLLKGLRSLDGVDEITLVTSAVGSALVKPLGLVDHCIAMDVSEYKQLYKNPLKLILMSRRLRNLGWDITCSVDDETTVSGLLAFFSGAPFRLGYDRIQNKGKGFYTERIHFDPNLHVVHNRYQCVPQIAKLLGVEWNGVKARRVPLQLSASDLKFVKSICKSDEPYLVIHPFAKYDYKEWPLHRYRELVEGLLRKTNCKILVLGDREADPWGMRNPKFQWVTGTTLTQLIALIDGATLFVGNNSGPMNIALNQDTPTIALNGPSAPWWFDPWQDGKSFMVQTDLPCQPCDLYETRRGHCSNPIYKECMIRISTDSVLKQILSFL